MRHVVLIVGLAVAACATPAKQESAIPEATKATDACLKKTSTALAKRSKDPQYVALKSYAECVEIARAGVRASTSDKIVQVKVIEGIEPKVKDRAYIVASEAIAEDAATDDAWTCAVLVTRAPGFKFSGRLPLAKTLLDQCGQKIDTWLSYHPEPKRKPMFQGFVDAAEEVTTGGQANKK